MARQRDVDWSDWKGHVEQPVHPLSQPLNKNAKTGFDSINMGFNELAQSILRDRPPQPTDEQMFGHLVVTEEMEKAFKKKWENVFNKHFNGFKQPVDHLNKCKIEAKWEYGKSFNSLLKEQLSSKEIAERNLNTEE